MASSYAIVESGGKQYRAEKGASLLVEHLSADEGAKVNLRAVMYRGDKDVVLDAKELEKVKVEAVVAEHLRGSKVRVFKYKREEGLPPPLGASPGADQARGHGRAAVDPQARGKGRGEAGGREKAEASRPREGEAEAGRGEGRGEAEGRREEAGGQEAGGEEAGGKEARGEGQAAPPASRRPPRALVVC